MILLHKQISILCIVLIIPGTAYAQNQAKIYKQEAIEWIDAHQSRFEESARAIHGFAEISLEEYQSAKYLSGLLEEGGLSVQRGVADMPTAFIATYGSGRPVIGILAEYDALPGLSQKPSLTRKEEVIIGAPGHGCGHNLFGAASIAAALAVKNVMENHEIKGTLKVFGCPAEETLVGKIYMAKAGLFDDLDACFSWHPGTKNDANLGSTLAMNNFEIVFRGKTAHGAMDPWNGRSALDAVELMNIGVNYLREHAKPTVRMHYVVKDGGMAPNIVPDYARVWYFVRDVDREGVEHMYERVLNCARGAALMTDTTMEINLITGVYQFNANRTLTEILYRNLREIGTPQFTEEEQLFAQEMQKYLGIPEEGITTDIEPFEVPKTIGGGSTDIADVSWIVPTAGELKIVSAPAGIPWHSWAVVSCSASTIGYKAMNTAAKVLAAGSIEVFMDKKVIKKARVEFEEKTEGFAYKSSLPADQKPPLPQHE